MRTWCGAVLAAVCAIAMSGCTGKDKFAQLYGGVTWKESGAVRIYDGEELVAEPSADEDAYVLRLGTGEHAIRIVNGKNKEVAAFTYSVPKGTVREYASAADLQAEYNDGIYFTAAEHLRLDYTDSGKSSDAFTEAIHLGANVRKVSIVSDARMRLTASFVLQARKQDIEFELENVELTGQSDTVSVIGYEEGASTANHTLVLRTFGIYNAIKCGYYAPSGSKGADSAVLQHGGNGGTGATGGNAVAAGNVAIVAAGDLLLQGGNGGRGGDGGSADGANQRGNGGNGGAGGSAIACDKLQLFALGNVTATGGVGGEGGKKGVRNSGWDLSPRSDGSAGAQGAGIMAKTQENVYGG